MRVVIIIKILAASMVLGAMGGTAYLMKQYTGNVMNMPGAMMEHQREIELKLKEKAESGISRGNEPGEKAFRRAKELLAMEAMEEAEEKLRYIVSFYPSAECAVEARRILSEINLDRLLDPFRKEGKKVVTVKKGDTFSRIVSENKTTMESLMHLSMLMRADHRSLHPGDRLTVMPLEMRVVIDIRRKTLTVWNGGEFIKEYPLLEVSYKDSKALHRCQIGPIRGLYNGQLYPPHAEEYYLASGKVITLSDKSLVIWPVSDETQDRFGLGFQLSAVDMEELPLLLRPGNDVEIRN